MYQPTQPRSGAKNIAHGASHGFTTIEINQPRRGDRTPAHATARRTRTTLLLLFLLPTAYCLLPTSRSHAEDAPKPTTTQPAQQDLDAAFTARLTNAVLAGSYTLGNNGPKKDRYTIVSVRKLKDDNWLFQARVQFGDKDVTIPMIIPVKWAGDTPVISVTDLGFPGLGSYTARVMIYGDQYAGTWQDNNNKAHSGHLWGKIEKAPATQPAATTKPKQ